MEYIIKGYLVLLMLSAVIMLVFLTVRMSKKRDRDLVLNQDRALFLREGFHMVVGVILFALFSEHLIGTMTTLAVSALLLIGFEYALATMKRRANERSLKPHGE